MWVNAAPEKVSEYMIANLESYMPEMKLKEECGLTEFMNMREGRLLKCPTEIEFQNLHLEMDTFFNWIARDKNQVFRIYAPGPEEFIFMDLSVTREAGGSRLKAVVFNEFPGSERRNIADIMMALSSIPGRMSEIFMDIKKGVEGIS